MKTQDGQILNCMSMCFDKFQSCGESESNRRFEFLGLRREKRCIRMLKSKQK